MTAPGRTIAAQLRNPSGLIGRVILPRLWNRRNAALNDLTLQCLDLQPDDRALEVGFGGGYLLGHLADVITQGFIAGADPSAELVAFCRVRYRSLIEAGRMELRQAGVQGLPFKEKSFTKVCTVNTIFYFPDLAQALGEMRRVLVEGGSLAICFTRKEYLQDREFSQHGLNLYEAEEVESLMAGAGFRHLHMVPGEDRWREFVCTVGVK